MIKTTQSRIWRSSMFLLLTAPILCGAAEEGEWIDLFNGKDMSGWIVANPDGHNGWKVLENGIVDNRTPSTDIFTEKWFRDFDAHVEFAIYPRSNAGLYLLGRYEIQIFDSHGRPPSKSGCGALYREVAPSVNASKPANEWQTFDINFRAAQFDKEGRKTGNGRITVVHNGQKILDDVEFDEPTGSRKRYNEEAPGPILIQGDHGSVKFRKFRIRGKVYDPPGRNTPGPDVIGLEVEPKDFSINRAKGVELAWRTPNHAYAPIYHVYRGTRADFLIDDAHLLTTSSAKRATTDCAYETDDSYYYRVAALGLGGVLGAPSKPVRVRGTANQVETPMLADASWALVKNSNTARRNRATSRKVMKMGGKTFEKGIGVRSPSMIRMHVSKMVGDKSDYRFRSTIGLDESISSTRRGAAVGRFIVKLDGKEAYNSGPVKLSDGARDIDVPIPAGTRRLELITQSAGPRGYDYCNWANARLEREK